MTRKMQKKPDDFSLSLSLCVCVCCRRFTDLWPRSFKSVGLFLNMFFSPLDSEGRALLDLRCHFTQDYLEEELDTNEGGESTSSNRSANGGPPVAPSEVNVDVKRKRSESERQANGGGAQAAKKAQHQPLTRRDSLKQEYMRKASIKHNFQPDHGFKGQMNAVSECAFHSF